MTFLLSQLLGSEPCVVQGDNQGPEYVFQDSVPLRETANPFPNLKCHRLDQGCVRFSACEPLGQCLCRDLANQ